MANNDMTLAGANQAQTQYVNYYNQIQKQLGANAPTIVAPSVQAPQQIQYQAVAAPQQLTANIAQRPGDLQASQIGSLGTLNTTQIANPGALQPQQVGQLGTLNFTQIADPGALQAQQVGPYGTLNAQQIGALGTLQAQQIAPQAALNAYTIQSPGQLTAQLVPAPVSENLKAPDLAAPERIDVERINVDQYTQQELANQIAAYLRPYTENAINARKHQTIKNRAAIDVDAASRGMGASTWVTDAKNRQAQAEASDLINLENTYLGNLNQGVANAWENQQNRVLTAASQNASAQNTANLNYAKLLQDYNTTKADLDWQATRLNAQYAYDAAVQNANAQMAADQFNLQNAMAVNQYNAQARAEADRYNAEREWNRLTTNANLAQQVATHMYDTEYDRAKTNASLAQDVANRMYDAENNRLLQNAQLAQQAALASYEARNDINARNAAAANDAARLVYSTEADRLSQNAQLAQQAALASYEAQNDVAVRNAAAANDAARLMYSTEADRLQQNAQLAQQAALASYSAQNDWENNRANILNSFAMYNNDNAYNAAIAERAYRDALIAQGREWAYDADKWNGQMGYNAQVQNADMWTTLQQLAWQRAAQLGELADVGGGDETPTTPTTGTGTFWSDLVAGAKKAAAEYDAAQLAKARAATPKAGSGGGGMTLDPSMYAGNAGYNWSGYQDNRQPTTTPQDIISRTTGMYYDPSIADKNKRTTPTAKHDSNDKAKTGAGKPQQKTKN